MKFPKFFLWAVFFFVVAIVAYSLGSQNRAIKNFGINPQGVSFEFENIEGISNDELTERQNKLEARLDEFQRDLSEEDSIYIDSGNYNSSFNLTGFWSSNIGFSYQISQYGSAFTIQEVSPAYGITFVGQGTITGDFASLDYTAADYSQGRGTFNIIEGGSKINATLTNLMTGGSSNLLMFRQ